MERTADYPKNKFGEIRDNPKNYKFIEAVFQLDESEAAKVSEMTGYEAALIDIVNISRKFDGHFVWLFPNATAPATLDAQPISNALHSLETSIHSLNELSSESGLKARILSFINSHKGGLGDQISGLAFDALFTNLGALYITEHAKSSALHPRILQSIDELRQFHNLLHRSPPTEKEGLWEYFKSQMPVFLYYSNYGNLDSEIYLPHVVENLKRSDLGEKEAAKARTLRVLFSFVGLNPEEILELGREFKDASNPTRKPTPEEIDEINKKKKERAILLQSAGTKLTGKFRDWWKQGDYRFRFDADGDHCRIWVSDDRRPDEVELEGRSTGLQWFLSFYLVFLVESEGDHKNAVLLLDEPGLSLHPLAQRNLSVFFENLSITNQIMFTTHSPFLVDADNLDKARKVYVADDGSTKATANLREGESRKSQPGATYAVNSALNLNVSESLLIGCEPVVVEGPSDQYILSAIKNLLIGSGLIRPKREFVFPPSGGAKSIKVIASILLGRDDTLPSVLVDDDTIGRSAAKELLGELYKGSEDKVVNIAGVLGVDGAEIEDLVPAELVIDIVDRLNRAETPFSDVYKPKLPIVPQIEKWAHEQDVALEKGWKVPLAKAIKKRLLAQDLATMDKPLVDRWVELFRKFSSDIG